MNDLRGRGLRLGLPAGWEGRIRSARAEVVGEATRPVVHAANFAIPTSTGDYGSGAVELMQPGHIFVSILEFGPESIGTPLFAARGVPRVDARAFDPNGMQRVLPPRAGFQAFFTLGDRPFCLYVVIGDHRRRLGLASLADEVTGSFAVE